MTVRTAIRAARHLPACAAIDGWTATVAIARAEGHRGEGGDQQRRRHLAGESQKPSRPGLAWPGIHRAEAVAVLDDSDYDPIMGLIVGLLVLWVILSILGFVIHGLIWLAIVGIVLFLITGAFGLRGRSTR